MGIIGNGGHHASLKGSCEIAVDLNTVRDTKLCEETGVLVASFVGRGSARIRSLETGVRGSARNKTSSTRSHLNLVRPVCKARCETRIHQHVLVVDYLRNTNICATT